MERAVATLENLIDLTKTVKITALDKVLFCIYRGASTPKELTILLNVSKGNLANYCKNLAAHNKIKRIKNDAERGVTYVITDKGIASVQKILKNIENHITE